MDTSVLIKVGNVLIRALGWPADDVAAQLEDILTIFDTPLVLTSEWRRDAAGLATEHRLSFYDAAWAAAARGLGVRLVSSDWRLVDAGVAESPTMIVQRLGLSPR